MGKKFRAVAWEFESLPAFVGTDSFDFSKEREGKRFPWGSREAQNGTQPMLPAG
jgi:hypothetical protein